MSDDDFQHVMKLREVTRDRLRVLEIQRASFGGAVPSHIEIELERARRDLAVLEARAEIIAPSDKVVNAVGPVETGALLLELRVKRLDEKLDSAIRQLMERVVDLSQTSAKVLEGLRQQVDRLEATTKQTDAKLEDRYRLEQLVRVQRQTETDQRQTLVEDAIVRFDERLSQFEELRASDRFRSGVLIVLVLVFGSLILWRLFVVR